MSTSSKSKCKKSVPSKKRNRDQRKKILSNDDKGQENGQNGDSNFDRNSDQPKELSKASHSYPRYVIKKKIGCGRSGQHRKKKPLPKIPPKLTVVISKVGGQIIAKKKEDNPVKLDTNLPLNPTSLGRKSLEV